MRKSKYITLVLISAALASCDKKEQGWDEKKEPKVYMRSDSTANYSRSHHGFIGGALLWYYAFRPYGRYNNGVYSRAGYYSGGISERSNIGANANKSGIIRGGFGKGSTVSS